MPEDKLCSLGSSPYRAQNKYNNTNLKAPQKVRDLYPRPRSHLLKEKMMLARDGAEFYCDLKVDINLLKLFK